MGYSASYINAKELDGLRPKSNSTNEFLENFFDILKASGITAKKYKDNNLRENVNVLECVINNKTEYIYFTGGEIKFWNFSCNVITTIKDLDAYLVVMYKNNDETSFYWSRAKDVPLPTDKTRIVLSGELADKDGWQLYIKNDSRGKINGQNK